MPQSITALILTFNEEQHIERCIRSLEGVVERVCVIDSLSTDRTVEIAKGLGATVLVNPWKNYATQFQFGLDNCDITTEWTMRIDADEYLESGLRDAMQNWLASPPEHINAVYLRRKMVFLERPITHGFFYPAMMLRLWKTGQGRIEQRWMDEHVIVENVQSATIEGGDLVDHNLNDLGWWVSKHNGYATREVYDMVEILERENTHKDSGMEDMTGQAARKRWLKENLYSRLPTTLRAGFYFFYRYVIGRGFLDGKEGFFFHFLQAFWYRTLVEAKLFELEKQASAEGISAYDKLCKNGILEPRVKQHP
ncbi:glycosyltransferase family 2 protein [Celeribacter baekdonensis]|uniref:glycosyltransferase family 2 protein n=1 Tax=Celeribacter baekdonensis TaxID=875171 RepID=UPI0026EF22C6|nr:glycosyltransferase family 2 protein [Celeribacter baekdonensis]|tara:strand:- start:12709 stop:13635 length:927 start_codon:yes stop_codon:yes gene_type:complete